MYSFLYSDLLAAASITLVGQPYKNWWTAYYLLEATLSRADPADSAPILDAVAKEKYKRDYYFQYYDADRKCAVFTFDHGLGIPKCEIHIWKKMVERGPSQNCKREYEYLCPRKRHYEVYENTCF
ncbi:uncharacterized protein LOC142591280 isoform X2 [Dermacentor variabilis]|uniref:uncharacterized protein LOC142591280 isoform X2 n=1 Tax=Dermacentor variabilis TaxID=34621 RepID=UPI003F5C8F94